MRVVKDTRNGDSYFFEYRGWKEIGELVFEIIAPLLLKTVGEDVYISVDIFNAETPQAELRFRIEL